MTSDQTLAIVAVVAIGLVWLVLSLIVAAGGVALTIRWLRSPYRSWVALLVGVVLYSPLLLIVCGLPIVIVPLFFVAGP